MFKPEYNLNLLNAEPILQDDTSAKNQTAEVAEVAKIAEIHLPTISETVYENLPEFLKQASAKATTPEEKDILLLGTITAVSACLPNIYGIYAERKVFPNLYLFVTAAASSGKGRLTLCRKIVEPIHRDLREQAKIERGVYQAQMIEYNAGKNKGGDIERPQEPPMRMLLIPANNSATGFFQLLNDNDGAGLIFETEGDTLSQTFKSEHGNFSDGFRKAFHHEAISYNRRKEREYVEIEMPRLSALLSGTPRQVQALIPSAENGLFSRFMFYCMDSQPTWRDVFKCDGEQVADDYFYELGQWFFQYYAMLKNRNEPTQFSLTSKQQSEFNIYFDKLHKQYTYLLGIDYNATVLRLGLIAFRVAMVLTVLREMENAENVLVCRDNDFNTALSLVDVLIQHAAKVFNDLPVEAEVNKRSAKRQALLEALPPEFSRSDYITAARNLGINERTVERYIKKFVDSGLVCHLDFDSYQKVSAIFATSATSATENFA